MGLRGRGRLSGAVHQGAWACGSLQVPCTRRGGKGCMGMTRLGEQGAEGAGRCGLGGSGQAAIALLSS